jgi:pimeloyl-ACP methyl ester carboxylesterase
MIASFDQIRLGYDEAGRADGPPVLFLHGFPHNRTLWSAQLVGLAQYARCIAVDLRGFGESSVSPPYSMDQYADDIAGFMDKLQIAKAVICGLSMGGYIALAMWRRHQQRVHGLILADTKATADSDEAKEKRRKTAQLARDRGAAAVADQVITGMVGKHTRETAPHVVENVFRMCARANVAGIVGALDAMRERPDSTPILPTIDVLTLIVVGEEDVSTPVADSETMHRAIYGSRLQVLSRAGHVSNVERPAAFNHVLGEFLSVVKHA